MASVNTGVPFVFCYAKSRDNMDTLGIHKCSTLYRLLSPIAPSQRTTPSSVALRITLIDESPLLACLFERTAFV